MKYGNVPCFWCERISECKVYLRVFTMEPRHNATIHIDTQYDSVSGMMPEYDGNHRADYPPVYDERDDWPTVCDCHGEPFPPGAQRQVVWSRLFQAPDGRRYSRQELPPGAMYNASWWPRGQGPDGITLMAILPCGHEWLVDGTASNCQGRDVDHFCWPREGDPRIPGQVTVTKKDGNPCKVGAGSIGCRGNTCYHGFLRQGALVDA